MKKEDIKRIVYINLLGFFLLFVGWVIAVFSEFEISKYISAGIIFTGFMILSFGNGLIGVSLLTRDSPLVDKENSTKIEGVKGGN